MSRTMRSRIAQVRRRVNATRFLAVAAWTVSAALAIGCGMLMVDKLWHLGLPVPGVLAWSLAGGLLVAGAIVTVTWRSPLEAAIELDRAFGLKERVSTLLGLDDATQSAPAGLALRNDVERRLDGLVVREHVPIRLPKHGWVPVAALALLLAIGYLVGPLDWLKPAAAHAVRPPERQRIVQEAQLLSKRIQERKKRLDEGDGAEELKELATQVDSISTEITRNQKLDTKEAVLKLSDLAKTIEKRRERLQAIEQMRRALAKLSSLQQGPGQKLAQALKDGDFKEAKRQLQQVQKKLQSGNMTAEQKKQLAEQLANMQQQLQKLSDLSKRAEQLRKNLPADMLQQQLSKLAEDAEQLAQLRDLAQKLGNCSQCLSGRNGDGQDLTQTMMDAQTLLDEMVRDEMAREVLEGMLDDLGQCRAGMCQGEGVGNGLGRGSGVGDRPEAKDQTRARKTRSRSKLHKGPAFVVGRTPGQSFRGDSKLEIQQTVANTARAVDEAITRQKVPRDYREHTQEYFQELNNQLGK